MKRVDVAVVGGGIVGLAFAWEAARRGLSVALFERSTIAQGASVRNFGMVWPIGQPPGNVYRMANRSRARWLEAGQKAGIWVRECGSLHVVYEDDERQVLEEFAARSGQTGIVCEYVTPAEAVRRYPAVNPDGLRGALYSPTELVVDPPSAIARLPKFLAEQYGVNLQFGQTVTAIDMPRVHTASGEVWHADRVFVCSGTDFETLFPSEFAKSGIRRCKLQMLRTVSQPNGWRIGTHLAGGLTLCHYKAFDVCPSLPALKKRIAETMPEFVKYGIHVMASQNSADEVVIGDTHEYDGDISLFDSPYLDDLIVNYLRKMVRLPDWTISRRWHGLYTKHPTQAIYYAEPQPNCTIVSAPGGAGMTLSFGYAEEWWDSHASANHMQAIHVA